MTTSDVAEGPAERFKRDRQRRKRRRPREKPEAATC